MEKNIYHYVKQNYSGDFLIPPDILRKQCLISAIGHHRLCVENFKHLMEFDQDHVLIQGFYEWIQICGTKLSLDYLSDYEVEIVGNIFSIEYLKNR